MQSSLPTCINPPMFFYPFMAALLSTVFAAGYKIATLIRAERSVVNATFLSVSAVISGVICVLTNHMELNRMVVLTGILSGIMLYSCVAAFFQVMRYGRLAIQWTAINMAIVIPTAVAIVAWGERPALWTILGFILTATAMILIGVDKGKTSHTDDSGEGLNPAAHRRGRAKWIVLILIAFAGTGGILVCHKAIIHYGQAQNRWPYLFVMYFVAAVLATINAVVIKPRGRWLDVAVGGGMAIANVAACGFVLLGLMRMPAAVFLPVRSVFGIMVTAAVSVILWKERIQLIGIIGLVAAAAAIAFLSR